MKKRIAVFSTIVVMLVTAFVLCISFQMPEVYAEPTTHTHCLCVGNAVEANKHNFGHKCADSTVWTPIGTAEEFLALADDTSSPHVYLTADISITQALEVPTGKIFLCLNGHNITSTDRVFTMTHNTTSTDSSKIYITDCQGEACGTIQGASKESGGTIYITAGKLYIYNGNITSYGRDTTSATGGVVYVKGISSSQKSIFYFLGGNMHGGYAKNGGNLTLSTNTTAYFFGGSVFGGNVADWGGNVNLGYGSAYLSMTAGKIYAGVSGKFGANLQSSGTVNLSGGAIYGGTAGSYGGNVNTEGTITMSGGVIWGGTASTYGGNVSIKKSFELSGGEIYDGKATTGGGNVCVYGGTFTMKGGEIRNGALYGTNSKFYGGNVYVYGVTLSNVKCSAKMTLSAGTIKGGVAYRGGNVYVAGFEDTSFTMSGGTLSDGVATNYGGNLAAGTATVTMTGGTITGGIIRGTTDSTTNNAANFYASSQTGTYTFTGGEITGRMSMPYNFLKLTLGGSFKCHSGAYGLNISNTSTDSRVQNIYLVKTTEDADIYMQSFNRGGNANWTGSTDATLFAGEVSTDFTESDLNGFSLSASAGAELILQSDRTVHVSQTKSGCICGGKLENGKTYGYGVQSFTHVCNSVAWTKWTSTSALPTVADVNEVPGDYYFYLTSDVTLSGSWNPGKLSSTTMSDFSGYHFYIDFNGKTVTTTSNARFLTNYTNSVYTKNIALTLTDSKQGGGVTIKENATHTTNSGSLFWMNSKAGAMVVDIYGGVFNGNGGTNTTASGMINIASQTAVLNIYGGEIICQKTGSDASSKNAGVFVSAGTVNMYGGTIRDGVAKYGGNVNLTSEKAIFNLFDGEISGGSVYSQASGFQGGNVAVFENAVFNQYGGTVKNGKAYAGGNYYVYYGNLNIYGGEIFGGYTDTNGCNITDSTGVVTVYGGTIGAGASGNSKSNIGVTGYKFDGATESSSKFIVNGGTIQSILLISGRVIVNDGTFIGTLKTYQSENAFAEINGGYFRSAFVSSLPGEFTINGGHFASRPEADNITIPSPKQIFESSCEKDGKKYYYTVGEGVNVVVTSTGTREGGVLKTGSEYTLATLQGPGQVAKGDAFTLTAKAVSGYRFSGWYSDAEGEALSTSATFVVENGVSEDTSYIAYYELLTSLDYQLKVITQPAGFFTYTVLSGRENITTGYDFQNGAKVAVGSAVTVKHGTDSKFIGWYNQSEKLISASDTFDIRIGIDTEIHARYNADSNLWVIFKNEYNQVLSSAPLSDLSSLPSLPFRVGKTATGWTYNGTVYAATADGLTALSSALSNAGISNGTAHLTAAYAEDEATYTVKLQVVKADDTETWDGWTAVGSAEVITTTAKASHAVEIELGDRTAAPYRFVGFTDVEAGNILSTGTKLTYYPTDNTTIYAVFAPQEAEILPMVSWQLLKVLKQDTASSYTYSASALRSVPEPFVMLEQGVLVTTSAKVADLSEALTALTIDSTMASRLVSSNTDAFGTTTVNIKNIGESVSLYFRAYVVYLDNSGARSVAYSDVAYGTGKGPMETSTPKKSFNDESFVGLILESPVGVTVGLKTGFDASETVSSTDQKIMNGVKRTYFAGVQAGNYTFTAKGSGYYSLTSQLTISSVEAATQYIVDANPGKKLGVAWEANTVNRYSEKLLANAFNIDKSQWPDYAYAFESPYFQRDSYEVGVNSSTSHLEMLQFINSIADGVHVKTYSYGTSPVYKLDSQVVVLSTSDLSGATTYEEAGQILQNNGKLTVEIIGGMHGNEPAGAEATLSLLKLFTSTDGEKYLNAMNLIVLPRINPDGSHDYIRNCVQYGFDMNRDQLTSIAAEVTDVHRVFRAFMPEAVLDLHEYVASYTNSGVSSLNEALLGIGHIYSETALRDYAFGAAQNSLQNLSANGFSSRYYPADGYTQINAAKSRTGRGYYAEFGGISFLVESNGITADFSNYARRVMIQCIAAQSILDYMLANPTLKTMVSEVRNEMTENYGTYDPNRKIVLTTSCSGASYVTHTSPQINFSTGKLNGTKVTIKDYWHDTVNLERTIPTAYFIPADASGIANVLATLDKHGITYTYVAGSTTVSAKQYKKVSASSASLQAESQVTFKNGVYVFEMNQVGAQILALMMEPDAGRCGEMTFAILGYITADSNNLYPIYRYEHNLSDKTW